MAELILTKGYIAIVDDDLYDELAKHKWTAVVTGGRIKRVYAYRRTGWDNAKRRWTSCQYLHRVIAGDVRGFDVDHINGDTLDNRRENLRVCDRSLNLANSKNRAVGISGFRGVTRAKSKSVRWQMACKGHTATFATPEEAARAYDRVAKQIWGEFAVLNFPEHGASPLDATS